MTISPKVQHLYKLDQFSEHHPSSWFLAGTRYFTLSKASRLVLGTHTPFYSMGNGNFWSGGKKADIWSRPLTSMQCQV